MNVAQFIKNYESILSDRKISKMQFYKDCGITDAAVSQWRKGKNNPSIKNVEKIAEYLGVTEEELLIGKEKSSVTRTELDEIDDKLNAEGHNQFVQFGRFLLQNDQYLKEKKRKTKVIPLLGNSFAAGHGEPDFGNPWSDYEVDEDSRAEFAIKINGDSMSPYLEDGSIALAVKKTPRDGEVGAFLLDGEFLVKQFCEDIMGNVYLFSLNRDRADADRELMVNEEHTLMCFGTVLMKRVPLPRV